MDRHNKVTTNKSHLFYDITHKKDTQNNVNTK